MKDCELLFFVASVSLLGNNKALRLNFIKKAILIQNKIG